ncbi:glycoside hydrolase family 5 protein [Haladaptatus sp. T7]|uniref:glycoside hydrolase family 5 protein n=1 Tax=Haladaptatus sp. T7 TaxID=2029368 RepID=UPI0021A2578D|nr:glycoside hydrolase family 5 protein [Haladaptatus sp. T7]GKZ14493.1 hypothetical protein HAL_23740 [Haladaptatus sp. T7]
MGATVETAAAAGPTPRLHTDGKWIRNPDGDAVKLRGLAVADPGFYAQYHPKSVAEVLKWATDESRGWYPNIVRLPCTQDSVAAFGGPQGFVTDVLRPAVDLLGQRGVYALVDYHLVRPYTEEATDNADTSYDAYPDELLRNFWGTVAPEFASDEHVLFELFNEPTTPAYWGDDETAWLTWRDTAQPWVDLVRSHAPETPVIIGSPRWTSVPNMAPQYPFDGDNLVYSGHIYPDNGQPSDFDATYGAPAEDVPIVITEFGWDPDSDGLDQGTNSGWGQPFRDWVASYENMGWLAWCFDDSWAPTMFSSPGSGANVPWTLKDAPEQHGGFIKQWLAETMS